MRRMRSTSQIITAFLFRRWTKKRGESTFGRSSNAAALLVWADSMTPSDNISFLSIISNSYAFVPVSYRAQRSGFASWGPSSNRCLVVLRPPRWLSHIDSKSDNISMNPSLTSSYVSTILPSLRRSCSSRFLLPFLTGSWLCICQTLLSLCLKTTQFSLGSLSGWTFG